ncbi:unnamed protein product, partial [Prorocentrum cordatum]
GDVCEAKIFSFVLKWICDNGPQERAFARIRRTVESASAHLPQMSFKDMSNDWMFGQCRTRAARQTFTDELRPQPVQRDQPDHPCKKQTRPGGAWRAFCREKLLESGGRADFALWSVEYCTLPPEEKARLTEIGQLATVAGRSGASTHRSSFGATPSEASREAKRNKIMHDAIQKVDLNPAELVLQSVEGSIPSLEEALTSCRAVVRGRREKAQSTLEGDVTAIREFCEDKGKAPVSDVEGQLPLASVLKFVAVPASGKIRAVEPDFDIGVHLGRAVSWAVPKYKTSGICQALEAFNEWAHDFIRHDAAPTEQPGLRTKRALVDEGRLVVKFSGRPDGDDLDDDLFGFSLDAWLHVGMMHWSPYRPTFMTAKPVDALVELPPREDRVYIKTCFEFKSMFNALAFLLDCPRWTATWYVLEYSTRPVGDIAPHTVPVLPLAGYGVLPFWPPSAAAGGKGAAPAGPAGAPPAAPRAALEGGVVEADVEAVVDDEPVGGDADVIGDDGKSEAVSDELEDLTDELERAREAVPSEGERAAQRARLEHEAFDALEARDLRFHQRLKRIEEALGIRGHWLGPLGEANDDSAVVPHRSRAEDLTGDETETTYYDSDATLSFGEPTVWVSASVPGTPEYNVLSPKYAKAIPLPDIKPVAETYATIPLTGAIRDSSSTPLSGLPPNQSLAIGAAASSSSSTSSDAPLSSEPREVVLPLVHRDANGDRIGDWFTDSSSSSD